MAAKKKTPPAPAAGLHTLKIGGRVRCTDDHVEGRIVWANGVSVKITWNDGEQVTWRRDSLAGRPIEILAGDEDQPTAPPAPAAECPAPESSPAAPELAQEPPGAAIPPSDPTAAETPPTPAETAPAAEPTAPAPEPAEAETAAPGAPAPTVAKPKRRPKAAAAPQEKKLSALDAAAKVLAETGTPMSCKELIGAMAGKSYWTSPGGKTPDATLCSAVLREIKLKGEQSRFVKAGPGRFARRGA